MRRHIIDHQGQAAHQHARVEQRRQLEAEEHRGSQRRHYHRQNVREDLCDYVDVLVDRANEKAAGYALVEGLIMTVSVCRLLVLCEDHPRVEYRRRYVHLTFM